MLTKTLPTLDIFFNGLGSLNVNIYGQDADYCVEPEDTDVITLEALAKEMLKNLQEFDTGRIEDPMCLRYAYNLVDSLREATRIIEDAIYEEDIDG